MSAHHQALGVAPVAPIEERRKRAAELREAQALLDELEPGSEQAASLIESAARKGIALRARPTLVDQRAIDALAVGLQRDFEAREAELARERRSKLLRALVVLATTSVVAALVVVLSGLALDRARAARAGESSAVGAALAPAVGDAPTSETPSEERPAKAVATPLARDPGRAALACPAPEGVSSAPTAGERASSRSPAESASMTDEAPAPSPEPTPSQKIEPYFGTRP